MQDIIITHLDDSRERGHILEILPIGVKFHSDNSGRDYLIHPLQFKKMEIFGEKSTKKDFEYEGIKGV